jgi:hypothetical protein
MTARYFAHLRGSEPVRYRDVPGSIGVLEALDKPMPIGITSCTGWDSAGLAVWRPTVGKAELPGRFVVVNREFRPVEG